MNMNNNSFYSNVATNGSAVAVDGALNVVSGNYSSSDKVTYISTSLFDMIRYGCLQDQH